MEEIKSQDLMINNWVEYDDKLYKIAALSEEYPFLNTDAFGVGVVTYKNIRGIPLTEDILLKCGFEKREITEDGIIYGLLNTTIIYGKTTDGDYAFFLNRYCNDVHLESLHQLQNLFKLLTGNDLKIEV